jgi:hypothetical protein
VANRFGSVAMDEALITQTAPAALGPSQPHECVGGVLGRDEGGKVGKALENRRER